MMPLLLFLIFLCWGSFLNSLAYRLIHGHLLKKRSFCPACKTTLVWYDLIPLISFFVLGRKCRFCKHPISWLYPFIEVVTAVTLTALAVREPSPYFLSYFIFFSALLVTIRTDLETMLISRMVTLALIPVGLICSIMGLVPISWQESIGGTIIGSAFLWIVARSFFLITKKEGLGQGDIDLIAFIGSFVGPFGCWVILLMSSISGTIAALPLVIGSLESPKPLVLSVFAKQKCIEGWFRKRFIKRPDQSSVKIPFGPFLAGSSIVYVLYRKEILHIVLTTFLG